MHILLYERTAYNQQDLTQALRKEGITLSAFTHTFTDKNKDDAFYADFSKELREHTYDAVMSVNYYPLIAQVCYEQHTKYLSWSYDCPLDVRHIEDTLGYPTNFAFFFDRQQAQDYKNRGFDTVYHLPLAADTGRLDRIYPSAAQRKQYACDISFVGNLYDSVYEELLQPLPEFLKGYLDGICESQLHLYGCFLLNELITPQILKDINDAYQALYPTADFHIIKEELSYTMSTRITNLERIRLLTMLARTPLGKICLYSGNTADFPKDLVQCGTIDYGTQMPLVFKCSKINLNISLKCIPSGIPLRAIDILSCGGFLLSNFQPELEEYFGNENGCALYGSMEECYELAAYYLSHDTQREKIARNGYEIVKEHFSYEKQLQKIFETAGILQ